MYICTYISPISITNTSGLTFFLSIKYLSVFSVLVYVCLIPLDIYLASLNYVNKFANENNYCPSVSILAEIIFHIIIDDWLRLSDPSPKLDFFSLCQLGKVKYIGNNILKKLSLKISKLIIQHIFFSFKKLIFFFNGDPSLSVYIWRF